MAIRHEEKRRREDAQAAADGVEDEPGAKHRPSVLFFLHGRGET